MKLKGEWRVTTHTRPDEDAIVSVALLRYAGVKITSYWFYKEGDESLPPQWQFKNILWIDRGRRDLDHHGIPAKTSAQIVAEELGLEEEWIQPILRHVKRVDLEGRSEPFDLADITKAISRNKTSDQEIIEEGVRIAEALMIFHEKSLQRDNAFVAGIIKDVAEKIPKVRRYLQLLSNPKFQRSCDLVEILCGEKELHGEESAKNLGKRILNYIAADIDKYEKAKEEVRAAEKIVVNIRRKLFIVAGESNNPKFNTAAREIGAAMVIQKNSQGQVQIFFNNQVLRPEIIARVSEDLIEILRVKEILLDPTKKIPQNRATLRQPGKIPEVPQWYFLVGERGGRLILNGSLTSPEVPRSKIPFNEIIEFAADVLRHHSNGARGGLGRFPSNESRCRGNATIDKAKKENAPKIVP